VPTRPPIDYSLCQRAERYATGEHVHAAANLLTIYLGEHACEAFRPECFAAAEVRLRAFVAKAVLPGALTEAMSR